MRLTFVHFNERRLMPMALFQRCAKWFGLSSLALAGLSGAAAVEPLRSVYTPFDAEQCQHRKGAAVEDYGGWTCPGYGAIDIRLGAGDQRMYVSFGDGATLAARQTFPGFNNIAKGKVEWRLEAAPNGQSRPFATLLRWNVATADDRDKATGPIKPSARVLVVTRLGPGGVCHVGYVDARANAEANALARRLADETARKFRCGVDKPLVRGAVTPGLALPE